MAFAMLSSLWGDFMSAVGASQRVFELMDRVPRINPTGGREVPRIDGHVRFENVKYGHTEALFCVRL